MIKVKPARITAALLITLYLSACSGSSSPESGEVKAGTAPAVNLSVWCPKESINLMNSMAQSFSAAHESEAQFNFTISEESEKTCKETVLASPENAADVFLFASDQFESLRKGGALLPVTLNTEKIIAENGGADSGAISGASSGGVLYAYPETASNGYFLYYNSSYFTGEDIKSFDKMLEIAEKNGKKIIMDFTSGWYMYSFFKGAGLSVDMNEDGITNSCDWNSVTNRIKGTDVVEAMLRIASSKGFLNGTDDDFKSGVKDGSIIAGINGAWNSGIVSEAWGDSYAAAPLPKYTAAGEELQMHSFAGYKYAGVSAYTDCPEWSMAFAEWITNEENQIIRFRECGEGPSNVNAANSAEIKAAPALAALSAQSAYGHLQNVADTYWTPTYAFGMVIVSGNSDGKDLQQLVDELTADICAAPAPGGE